jgi:hypothetical protein
MYRRFKPLSTMLLEIEELPGSLDLINEEIYVPRKRSVPSLAGAFVLI